MILTVKFFGSFFNFFFSLKQNICTFVECHSKLASFLIILSYGDEAVPNVSITFLLLQR